MKREIRFRAWLEKEKKMATYISSMKCSSDGVWEISVPFEESGIHHYRIDSGEATLMQFTGLKDKNGKEIYEGDIIQFRNHGTSETFGSLKDAVIEWDEDRCSFVADISYPKMWCDVLDRIHIIGNIYENPELLYY